MKKLLSFTSALCLLLSASAQITIGSSDLPQAGTTYTLQESTPDPLFDYSATGEGIVWDYSELEATGELEISFSATSEAAATAALMFNNAFLYPDYVCYGFAPGEFPDLSQMGIELPIEIGEMNNFYQIDESYNIAGITVNMQGVDMPVQFDDIDEVYPLPMNYGSEFNSTSAYTISLPGVLTYSSSGTRSVSVDGWGTLQLPNGDEHEVLRVTSTTDMSDNIEFSGQIIPAEYSITTHQWLAQSGGLPVLEVSTMFGAAYRVRYQGESTEIEDTTGVYEIASLSSKPLKVFPNPVAVGGIVNLEVKNSNSAWEVLDSNGKIQLSGIGTKISTDALEAGIYFVVCREEGNEPTVLIVQ